MQSLSFTAWRILIFRLSCSSTMLAGDFFNKVYNVWSTTHYLREDCIYNLGIFIMIMIVRSTMQINCLRVYICCLVNYNCLWRVCICHNLEKKWAVSRTNYIYTSVPLLAKNGEKRTYTHPERLRTILYMQRNKHILLALR